jgi:hypothetical protein
MLLLLLLLLLLLFIIHNIFGKRAGVLLVMVVGNLLGGWGRW